MRAHLGFALLFFYSLSAVAATVSGSANQRELLNAVNAGNKQRAETLLKARVDLNAPQPPWRLTPLLVATENGNVEMVKMLIAYKADVNVHDRDGITALIRAVVQRDVRLVELLLDAGAQINAKDGRGHTALTTAVLRSEPEILKMLIARGADVDVTTAIGTTPWSIAQHMHEAALTMPPPRADAHHHVPGQAPHPMRSKAEALAQTQAVLKILADAGVQRPQQTVKNFDAMDYHRH